MLPNEPTLPPRHGRTQLAQSGDPEVRLIGTMCADHAATVVARWEDEFPLCKEIRRLKEE